ncbi:TIGR01777 family oxidoreductase [Aliarcobacter butzleri]|uniref:TIGR01777 family oxidoreductase n=1 Tax=Aliarcobacter butzleri TaxID=28197 RepID=UPI0021B3557C|nr:TIGR01777 family oxidoreductase [Aliarcobacter butzleri]MCT7618592.1 TIGR01777 family oxidoreductase [Aliarcobacter butzleri]MDN5081521.1 TIGR01777 family oxidoreductase [Aliarcobacter butzleri]MDN5083682.1 TIGR01777 family oxidoreductase [Aliarcobacter butzleri]MDN5085832.1 TIGR01777 family oxidoreductase [Aliarcobacter butzleri]
MKTIAISGANGFVGTSLTNFFSSFRYKIVPLSRDILNNKSKLEEVLNSTDIVINLAGANIINRWSESYKKLLYSSRIDTTSKIVNAISSISNKPKLLISTSAVGIYDNKSIYDENGSFSNDFLSNLCQNWEKEALKAKSEATKVAIFRFGIILGKDGGALQKMITPFKFGLGGTIGSGKQAFSFIHISDLLNAYKFVIENDYDGVFNLTAPTPTTNKGLTLALGKTLKRPTILPVPEFVLKLIFSEGARVLTDGQSAIPKKLLDLGFEFKFKTIEETIENLCS